MDIDRRAFLATLGGAVAIEAMLSEALLLRIETESYRLQVPGMSMPAYCTWMWGIELVLG